MKVIIGIAAYILVGIAGRKIFKYEGLIETILWPVGIPCALYLKRLEEEEEDDETD